MERCAVSEGNDDGESGWDSAVEITAGMIREVRCAHSPEDCLSDGLDSVAAAMMTMTKVDVNCDGVEFGFLGEGNDVTGDTKEMPRAHNSGCLPYVGLFLGGSLRRAGLGQARLPLSLARRPEIE